MKRWWNFVLAAILALAVAGCGGSETGGGGETGGSSDSLIFGTSSQGSPPHAMSVAMADIISQQTDISVTVQSVGGSDATVRAVNDGNADIGMVNMFAATNAFNGEPPFEQPVDIRMQIWGYSDTRQLIVRADSGIETPADLEGKRIIGERPALAEIRLITDAIIEAYGVDPGSVEIISTAETNEAINALQQGTVDAAVLPGGPGSGPLAELAQNADVRWIDLSDNIDQVLENVGPAFTEGPIPAGTYKGQDEEITAIGLNVSTIVGADMSDDIVYETTKAVMENPETLEASHPSGDEWNLETLAEATPTVPFHPGAIRYYEEAGAWTEELQQMQEELSP